MSPAMTQSFGRNSPMGFEIVGSSLLTHLPPHQQDVPPNSSKCLYVCSIRTAHKQGSTLPFLSAALWGKEEGLCFSCALNCPRKHQKDSLRRKDPSSPAASMWERKLCLVLCAGNEGCFLFIPAGRLWLQPMLLVLLVKAWLMGEEPVLLRT